MLVTRDQHHHMVCSRSAVQEAFMQNHTLQELVEEHICIAWHGLLVGVLVKREFVQLRLAMMFSRLMCAF